MRLRHHVYCTTQVELASNAGWRRIGRGTPARRQRADMPCRLGGQAGKPALYSLALGSVFVSEYEGFGLPVVEAMGCKIGNPRDSSSVRG